MRAASKVAVTSATYIDLFKSSKESGGDGPPIQAAHVEVPLKDSSGADVAGAATFKVRPSMNDTAGDTQEVTLYPGEIWTPTSGDRNTPISGIEMKKAGASDSCVVFRPLVF